MAEAIGLGASIAGLAAFGAQIVTNLRTYASAYQRAESKINDLSGDLALINSILTDLGTSITKYEVKFHITAKNFNDAKATCERNFGKLNKALKEVKREDVRRKGKEKEGTTLGVWEKLKFALGGETELNEFLLSIESSKSTLQLLLESFKLFILLRLHELNEEQMEDIKLLNRKVPVMVRGIRRAGLVNFEPSQRQLDWHPSVEPITVMHVGMIDGPTDLRILSARPPERSRSLETRASPLALTPTNYKEMVAAHQQDAFYSFADPGEPSNHMQDVAGSVQRGSLSGEQKHELAEASQDREEEVGTALDPPNDPPNASEPPFSMIPPASTSREITMDEQKRSRSSGLGQHERTPQKNSSFGVRDVFGFLINTISPTLLTRDVLPTGPDDPANSDKQRELPRSSPEGEMAAVVASPSSNNNPPAPINDDIDLPPTPNPRKLRQSSKTLSVLASPQEGFPQRPDISPSTSPEIDVNQQKYGWHGNGPPPSHYVPTEANNLLSFPVIPSGPLDDPDLDLQRESHSPVTQSESRSDSLDTRSIYEGWLLEAPLMAHLTPAFTVSCCSRSPIHLHTNETPLWTMHPFSRDPTILKSRLSTTTTNPSSSKIGETATQDQEKDAMIAALSPDAREEINELLHDRNNKATKRYGWRLAALTPYPSPISTSKSKSKFSLRPQSKKRPERYLIILRGGPISPSDKETPKVLLGTKEDLPDRHSNPWALRERERGRIRARIRRPGGFSPAASPAPPPKVSVVKHNLAPDKTRYFREEQEVQRESLLRERERLREEMLLRADDVERSREIDVRTEKRVAEALDEPYELERFQRETEYYEPPEPLQPIVIRARAPEPQQIILQEAPAPLPIYLPQPPREEAYQVVRREVKEVARPELREPRRAEDEYYYRRDSPLAAAASERRRRRYSVSDTEYSDDSDYVIRRRIIRKERSQSPEHKMHLAEGALAGAGAAALLANHREKQGNGPENRGRKVVGGAALGALGAEVLAPVRVRSRYRESRESRSRSRPRSSSTHRRKIKSSLGIAAAGLAAAGAAKYMSNCRADNAEAGRGRSRTRSISRRRYSDSDISLVDPEYRASQMAKAGVATAAVAGVVEHLRSKSRKRSEERSKSRVRTGAEIAASGLASAAVTGLYENRKAKEDREAEEEEAEVRRGRTRSRSRSSVRSISTDSDFIIGGIDFGMAEYGAQPVYSHPNYSDPALAEIGKDGMEGISDEEAKRLMAEFLRGFSADEEALDLDVGGVTEKVEERGQENKGGYE